MKIRTQINGLLVLVMAFILIACSVALYAEHQVDTEIHEMLRIEDLIGDLEDLRKLTVETALLHDQEAALRWQTRLHDMQADARQMLIEQPDNALNFRKLLALSDKADLAYQEFHIHTGAHMDSADEARTIASLFVITQHMIDLARTLVARERDETNTALHLMELLTLTMALAIGLLIVFVWRMVRRDILRPLAHVEQGTGRIAAGDFSHRLNLPQHDEIGHLAHAFDSMSECIWHTQNKLQQEVANSHRAEAALRDSVEFTRVILDNAADGMISFDRQGVIGSVNNAIFSIFGYPPEQVLGKNIHFLMPALDMSCTGQNCDLEGQHCGGYRIMLELAVSTTTYQGQPLYVAVVRDVSERNRIDQMKAEFVSTVSHELRTPLTSISGSLGLVTGGALGPVPPQILPMLSIAHKNSVRLSHLIDDLLDMEKLVAGKFRFDMQVQELMPLIEQSVEATRAYGEQLKVSFWIMERADHVLVQVDGNRLQQIMANFLSNAAKFSPTGGQVQIKVRRTGDRVIVSITDHGPGIPVEFHQRIFQKFSQADSSDTRQKGGTGLGLAITKELIERMNGSVGFTTTPGAGTTFYFELPLIQLQSDLPPHPDNALARILVVEDEPNIVELVSVMLHRAGYQVDVAYDHAGAVKCLAEHHYAGITLDLMLPDQSGVSLIEQIRHNPKTESLPVIVLSAYTEEGKLALNQQFAHIEWLKKPFEEAQLQAILRRALPSMESGQHDATHP